LLKDVAHMDRRCGRPALNDLPAMGA